MLPSKTDPISHKQCYQAALLFIVLSLTRLLYFDWNQNIFGGIEGDAGIYVYLAKTLPETLFSLNWFDTKAFYPYGHTLAWSDSFIAPAFLIHVFDIVGLTFVQSYNLYFILCFFLNGFCTFLLSRSLTISFLPSLFAGIAFEESMFLKLHLGHPQLQCAFFIPLMAYIFLKNKNVTTGIFLGLTFCLAFISSVYISFFAGLVTFFFLLCLNTRKVLNIRFILGAVSAIIIFTPFFLPYLEVQKVFGGRKLFEGFPFAASIQSYLSPPALSFLYGERSALNFLPVSHSEAQLFPGTLLILLTLLFCIKFIGKLPTLLIVCIFSLGSLSQEFFTLSTILPVVIILFLLYKKYSIERLIAFFLIFSICFSFGSQKDSFSLHQIICEIVSPLLSLRATGRFGIVSHLFFALSSAFYLSYVLNKLPRFNFIIIFLIGSVYFEQTFFVLQNGKYFEIKAPFTEELKNETATIFLPYSGEVQKGQILSWGDFAKKNVEAMWTFQNEDIRIINGFSGLQGRLTQKLASRLALYPQEESLRSLREIIGVNYFITHTDWRKDELKKNLVKESEAFSLFELGDISFYADSIFYAPYDAKKITLKIFSDQPCKVSFSTPNEQSDFTANENPQIIEISLPSPENTVQPHKIIMTNHCNPLRVGDSKIVN